MRGETLPFDTLSEVSYGTGGTSQSGRGSCYGDSREDLRDLAAKLGADLYDERFRVDRSKLEKMIIGKDEVTGNAEEFFKKVQLDTDTLIIWPSRLKIGAKSKKDPNIRIAGRKGGVKSAKEMVISVLDARSNRVTMKLDVSYNDHSHIIGRRGETIQRVMKKTGCHIHFPDSNRNNSTEKSNQVSIAGDMEGVEAARESVRNLAPLTFSFELPIVGSLQPMDDISSLELEKIQEQYNVQVSFRTRPKLHATLVVVKGSELELARVKEATLVVINFMCKDLASQVLIQMTVEISPQNHPIVLGENSINLKMIMHATECQIMFPDAEDPNIPNLKKSNIQLTGKIHNVYLARQMLLGSLPLVLMFDLPNDAPVENDFLTGLMQTLGVNINIRNKPKQSSLSVVIRSVERNASKIYEARHKLLGLEDSPLKASIPDNYHISSSGIDFTQLLNINTGYSLYPPCPSPIQVSPMSPITAPWGGSMPPLHSPHYNHLFPPALLYGNHYGQQYGHQYNHQYTHGYVPMGSSFNNSASSGYVSRNSNQFTNSSLDYTASRDYNAYSPISSNNSGLSSPSASVHNTSPPGLYADPSIEFNNLVSNYLASQQQATRNDVNVSDEPLADSMQNVFINYNEKRLQAAKAMKEKLTPGTIRLPTDGWAGYGFSQSSPSIETKHAAVQSSSKDPWSIPAAPLLTVSDFDGMEAGACALGTSNLFEAAPSKLSDCSNTDDITTLLSTLGLEKYIYMFTSHEIDLATFATLSENDLKEVGVKPLGARRKMLSAITDLKRRRTPFVANRLAPGAERKSYFGGNKTTSMDPTWQ